jgi:predicted metal-dependent phosphoesterase TrpH
MREFVSAGGELMIHGALQSKNSSAPEITEMFKIDLHIHTRLGGDSLINPHDLVERAREVGLDAVCITEHHSYDLSEPLDEISRKKNFPIFRGMEYRADNGHLLIYGVRATRGNLPPGLPVQKVVDWVNKNSGVAVPAHPYQKSLVGNYMGDDILKISGLVALEVLNGSVSLADNRRAKAAAQRLNINGIGGSDAHGIKVLGKVYTCFPAPVTTIKELTAAFRSGIYYPRWNQRYESA